MVHFDLNQARKMPPSSVQLTLLPLSMENSNINNSGSAISSSLPRLSPLLTNVMHPTQTSSQVSLPQYPAFIPKQYPIAQQQPLSNLHSSSIPQASNQVPLMQPRIPTFHHHSSNSQHPLLLQHNQPKLLAHLQQEMQQKKLLQQQQQQQQQLQQKLVMNQQVVGGPRNSQIHIPAPLTIPVPIHMHQYADQQQQFQQQRLLSSHMTLPGDIFGSPTTIGNKSSGELAGSKRKRSALVAELTFVRIFRRGVAPFDMIRVWKNSRQMLFYDCVCGSLKAVQDLAKVKKHAQKCGSERTFQCAICSREFDSHRKLNGHMLSHRRQKRMIALMEGVDVDDDPNNRLGGNIVNQIPPPSHNVDYNRSTSDIDAPEGDSNRIDESQRSELVTERTSDRQEEDDDVEDENYESEINEKKYECTNNHITTCQAPIEDGVPKKSLCLNETVVMTPFTMGTN